MGSLPPITIVVTSLFPAGEAGELRRKAVHETLASWTRHLHYDGKLQFFIADDGSAEPVFSWGQYGNWAVLDQSRQEAGGVGASLNSGFDVAFQSSPLVLYAVDDWALLSDFDLTPWAKSLVGEDWLGCVRLGPPHPSVSGSVVMVPEGWLLKLERYGYAFSFRPALYHKRFWDAYGRFEEGSSSLDCERDYNERFARQAGPEIALALPHPWDHQYSVELSAMRPEEVAR